MRLVNPEAFERICGNACAPWDNVDISTDTRTVLFLDVAILFPGNQLSDGSIEKLLETETVVIHILNEEAAAHSRGAEFHRESAMSDRWEFIARSSEDLQTIVTFFSVDRNYKMSGVTVGS